MKEVKFPKWAAGSQIAGDEVTSRLKKHSFVVPCDRIGARTPEAFVASRQGGRVRDALGDPA